MLTNFIPLHLLSALKVHYYRFTPPQCLHFAQLHLFSALKVPCYLDILASEAR